jgi:hypothetical protein
MPETIRTRESHPSAHVARCRVRPETASRPLGIVPFLAQTPIGFVWLIFAGQPLDVVGFVILALYLFFAAALSLAICAVVGVFIMSARRSPNWQYLSALLLCVLLSALCSLIVLVHTVFTTWQAMSP